MITFWLAYSALFLITTVASSINALLLRNINLLIDWMNETFRPALMNAGRTNDARDLRLKRIPVLEDWRDGTSVYSLITLGLQLFLLLLGGFVGSGVGVPYILLIIIILLLSALVVYFPRTLVRWSDTRKAIGVYFLAYAGLLREIQEKSDGNNTTGGTTPHG